MSAMAQYETLVANIRIRREKAKLSQRVIAEALGTTRETYNRVETGVAGPDRWTVSAIVGVAALLECSIADLFAPLPDGFFFCYQMADCARCKARALCRYDEPTKKPVCVDKPACGARRADSAISLDVIESEQPA